MENILGLSGLFVSFLGILFVVGTKIPILAKSAPKERKKRPSLILKLKPFWDLLCEKVESFSFYGFLHKILSKIKVFNLKTEKITDIWLRKIRQRGIEKKKEEDK
ncbi:MAG: hypothetical protein PHS29_03100 [Candidatus Pacebacteria bacterium]|nr:hypothetical protein [Candidatus Paceibacterota bacterium]MDD4201794.1 hypothetical protein [Candidatus Paceibacterota bacterium]MDD4897588.1 hypothetical protein [Candidatus Paceibacterota bacterium]